MFVNWNEPIILVEGVFDAIAIRNNAIPLLGKFPSKTLVMRLVEKQVKKIYVALDEDARQDEIKLSKFLMDYEIEKVETGEEFKVCPSCGYNDGFHSMFKKEGDIMKWLFICPSCKRDFIILFNSS